jgi:hypothetical protein
MKFNRINALYKLLKLKIIDEARLAELLETAYSKS